LSTVTRTFGPALGAGSATAAPVEEASVTRVVATQSNVDLDRILHLRVRMATGWSLMVCLLRLPSLVNEVT
jgi:hypothetical protein